MTRAEMQAALGAIVAAISNSEHVAIADIGEPLLVESTADLAPSGGFAIDPRYVAFLSQANGLSIRTYFRDGVGPEHHAFNEFEIVEASRVASATEEFRASTEVFLRDGLETSLRSYPHELVRRVLNESMFIGTSAFPTLLWSTGGLESGVYIVDDEYAGEPSYLKRIACSFDEYLERSLQVMLEQGHPVYY
jgi:hypothetical protein